LELIGGDLRRTQRREVETWAGIHREELMANWERLQNGQPVQRIEPLG